MTRYRCSHTRLQIAVAVALALSASCVLQTDPIILGERNPADPITLAEDQIDPFDIIVDGAQVYWMDWLVPPPVGWVGTENRLTVLMKADTAALTDPVLFDHGEHQGSSANPTLIGADSTDVYWSDAWGRFRQIAKTGGTPGVDIAAGGRVHALVVDTTHVFWMNHLDGDITQIEKATGTATQVYSDLGTLGTGLGMDSTDLYVIREGGFGEDALLALPRTGGAPVVVVESLPMEQFTLDGDVIYFASGDTIYKVRKTGGDPTVVAAGVSPISELAIDSTHVYWGDIDSVSGDEGVAIYRLDKTDDTLVAVASELPSVTDLALDSSHIYWTDREGGTVMKLAK